MENVVEVKSWAKNKQEKEHSRFVLGLIEELIDPTPGRVEIESYTTHDGTLVFQFGPERRP